MLILVDDLDLQFLEGVGRGEVRVGEGIRWRKSEGESLGKRHSKRIEGEQSKGEYEEETIEGRDTRMKGHSNEENLKSPTTFWNCFRFQASCSSSFDLAFAFDEVK